MADDEGLVLRAVSVALYVVFYSVVRWNARDFEEALMQWSSPEDTHKLAFASVSFFILLVGFVWTMLSETKHCTYRLALIAAVGGTLCFLNDVLNGLLLWYNAK